jgi:hypothetical protein
MTMKIWKWTLEVTDRQQLQIPGGAKLLTVQVQHGLPQLWALVDEKAPLINRTIATYGTGNPIPDLPVLSVGLPEGYPGEYVGTYQFGGGALVFHVFEEPLR